MAENNINNVEEQILPKPVLNKFEIAQRKTINGKQEEVGSQTIYFSEEKNIINIGSNVTENNAPICSIIKENDKIYLQVSKKINELNSLQKFSSSEDENFNRYEIKNITMYANEDISFELDNDEAKSFGKLIIKSNGIISEKNNVKTTLLALNDDEFLDIELPSNIIDLTKDDNLIKLRTSKNKDKFSLPAQIFENLKKLELNGTPNIKVKEWTNIGRKNQILRIVLYGDKILVGDGTELKEVDAGFKIVPDKDETGLTGKQDIIVRFDKSNEKVGESKNSKLLDGIDPVIIQEIIDFLPERYINGETLLEKTEEDIEHVQIESIKSLLKPRDKIGIVPDLNTIQIEPSQEPEIIPEPEPEITPEQTEPEIIPEQTEPEIIPEQTEPEIIPEEPIQKPAETKPEKNDQKPKKKASFGLVLGWIATIAIAAFFLISLISSLPFAASFLGFVALLAVGMPTIKNSREIFQDRMKRKMEKTKQKEKAKEKEKEQKQEKQQKQQKQEKQEEKEQEKQEEQKQSENKLSERITKLNNTIETFNKFEDIYNNIKNESDKERLTPLYQEEQKYKKEMEAIKKECVALQNSKNEKKLNKLEEKINTFKDNEYLETAKKINNIVEQNSKKNDNDLQK